jgi:membrane protease YdiL (CAAX protease family)
MISKRALLSFFIVTMIALLGDFAYRVLTTPQAFPWDMLVVLIVVSIAGMPLVIPLSHQKNQTSVMWGILVPVLIVPLVGLAIQYAQAYRSGQSVSIPTMVIDVGGRVVIWAIFASIVLYVARRSQSQAN